jgi:hypothetical protein
MSKPPVAWLLTKPVCWPNSLAPPTDMDFAEQLHVYSRGPTATRQSWCWPRWTSPFPPWQTPNVLSLKESLEAAAIPHWCDELHTRSLAGNLDGGEPRARLSAAPQAHRGGALPGARRQRGKCSRSCPAGDPQLDGGRSAGLVPHVQPAGGVPLRGRSPLPAGRIEWIYHRLCSAPDEAATELEQLDREWSVSARPEDRQALALALRELAETNFVHDRARVWVSLCIAWSRVARGETAQLGVEASQYFESWLSETGDASRLWAMPSA